MKKKGGKKKNFFFFFFFFIQNIVCINKWVSKQDIAGDPKFDPQNNKVYSFRCSPPTTKQNQSRFVPISGIPMFAVMPLGEPFANQLVS